MTTRVSWHLSELIRSQPHYLATRDGVFRYVTDHLIYEVLLRIPAESLLAFKIVCKDWYYIIRDPKFINQYRDYHATKDQSIGLVSLIADDDDIDLYDVTNINKLCTTENAVGHLLERPNEQYILKADEADEEYLKIASCNGLICFHSAFPVNIWNPVTRELMFVPQSGIDHHKEVATACGFGFDSSRNVYKVVQLYKRLDDSTLGYEVLSLDTAMQWRRPIQQKNVIHPYYWEFVAGQGAIFVDGSLYWHAKVKEQILCFDVTTEWFKLIQVPDSKHLDMRFSNRLLVGFDRGVCYLTHDNEMLHIWKMQRNCTDKKNMWMEDFSIDLSYISVSDSHIIPVCRRNKKIYLRYGKGLACYDMENQTFVVPVLRRREADYFEFVAYTKSIVCLKDIVGSSFVKPFKPIYVKSFP
ncbi:putative F-box protein At3g16210 [Papaver somniferum]|uniref:putative F-box protein At3g16210 n=1 Tax=Papaver somniferum TaxID=3469 RepID=UPI000E6FA683|nr:putative F-box protein At3g16210 [Papaver somniferum]